MASWPWLFSSLSAAGALSSARCCAWTPDGGGVSLVAMAGPMMLLYVFSIGLAWMFGKKKQIAA